MLESFWVDVPKEHWQDCQYCGGTGVLEDWDSTFEETFLDDCYMCAGVGGYWVMEEDDES